MWDDDWDNDVPQSAPKSFDPPKASVGGKVERKFYDNFQQRDYNTTHNKYKNFNSNSRQDRSNNRTFTAKASCRVVKIPSRCVGMIIGKKGATINNLQSISNTRIEITKDTQPGGNNSFQAETTVKIHGDNEEDLNTAENLILEKIDDSKYHQKDQKQSNRSSWRSSSPTQTSSFQDEFPSLDQKVTESASNTSKTFEAPPSGKTLQEQFEENERLYWSKFPPIKKSFYHELPEVSQMKQKEVAEFRMEKNNIMVERISFKEFSSFIEPGEKRYAVDDSNSKPIPNPVKTFQQAFHNYPEILEEIAKAGFTTPSPIQCQAWPILLSGEDMIGIAQTGTGKTLAFLLPALIHIDGQTLQRPERQGPAALIFAPTRELALQIDKEVKKYTYRQIKSLCVYGGGDRKSQINEINNGIDIVIATPGRLNDLYDSGKLSIEGITYVVLDEADRMLDMGFEPQIRKIMYGLRPERQCIMTSATFPNDVIRLATSYTSKPIKVTVGSLDLVATHSVTQTIYIVDDDEKQAMCLDYITKHFHESSAYNALKDKKILVFCRSKLGADNLCAECALKDISCASLHGAKEQLDREQSIDGITNGSINVLIATDLASRGLDISDLTHVLNYDFPKNIEEYVHRVGRTGRAGKSGESITYFTRSDWMHAEMLIKILKEANQEVPDELYNMAQRYEHHKKKREEEDRNGRGRGRGGFRGGRGRRGGFSSRW